MSQYLILNNKNSSGALNKLLAMKKTGNFQEEDEKRWSGNLRIIFNKLFKKILLNVSLSIKYIAIVFARSSNKNPLKNPYIPTIIKKSDGA